MTIQLIYTFKEKPQDFADYSISPKILESKEETVAFVLEPLTEDETKDLVKVSMSVNPDDETMDPPEWYLKCNGKLWFEDGVEV
jgi:hypothetical protein